MTTSRPRSATDGTQPSSPALPEIQTQRVAELHALADRVRFLVSSDALPTDAQHGLEAACRTLWERRALLCAGLNDLSTDQRNIVRQDLLDLTLFWIGLRVSLALAAEKNAVRRESLDVLTEAEALSGPSPALFHCRQRLATDASLRDLAEQAQSQGQALRRAPPGNT